ncbi:DUF4381 domain-containing protein [Halopseudomonas maritima]|uniref:DUF4381 domain-containing protein n=1 Tax=Halopseudomonas maritima TaxID=2918528 RepID=UPI001EEBEAB0|nr:DUF4381 domain-containing protein [Halopseudomonas maritima]UJJ33084.1 DUF4381 domain-containing protein [Halopseudomonas maritima]
MADIPIPELHDLALPVPISAWPPAPAACALLLLLALALLWQGLRQWRRYQRNAYRRRAVQRLNALQRACEQDPAQLQQLPGLLRHTALQVWPRAQVASLHGERWLHQLNQQIDTPLPPELVELGYWPAAHCACLDASRRALLFTRCRHWIQHHVCP